VALPDIQNSDNLSADADMLNASALKYNGFFGDA
jgi:hypothetical protein